MRSPTSASRSERRAIAGRATSPNAWGNALKSTVFTGRLGAVLVSLCIACTPPRAPVGETTTHTSSVARDPACGETMLRVGSAREGFCIDAYERPGFDALPDSFALEDAARHCSRRGARLCTEREWERACRGPEGARYPYGDVYRASACRTESAVVAKAGMHNACRSGYGIYDLSGNAAEWVAGGLLKGGDHASDAFASRCGARASSDEPDSPQYRGVRCCKDLQPVR